MVWGSNTGTLAPLRLLQQNTAAVLLLLLLSQQAVSKVLMVAVTPVGEVQLQMAAVLVAPAVALAAAALTAVRTRTRSQGKTARAAWLQLLCCQRTCSCRRHWHLACKLVMKM
jgi:hypothetical protein